MSPITADSTLSGVRAIYDRAYADRYEELYIQPWQAKHEMNRRLLDMLMPRSTRPDRRWLDLCCGQAWHFSCYPEVGWRLGVDLSPAQLQIARLRNPQAQFLCANVLEVTLPQVSYDLVTCFWGAYCYLDDNQLIATLLQRMLAWTAPGGALYLELLTPDVLASFNASEFAQRTGFRVEPRSGDYTRWSYSDAGGHHLMTSPTREWFLEQLTGHFRDVRLHEDGGFMSHLVATGHCKSRADSSMLTASA